jgi:hypothetical protein
MTHLTSDEFEDILRGAAETPAHLHECPACSARLAEMRAIQERLRKAFRSVQPRPDLADRLRERVRLSVRPPGGGRARPSTPDARPRFLRLTRPWWTASVAALVLIAVGLMMFLGQPQAAMAGRAELVQIYENSLCLCRCAEDTKDTCRESDPEKLSQFMQKRFGFVPLFPLLGSPAHSPRYIGTCDLVLRGGCAGKFRGQEVPAYVLQEGEQPITVVVIPEPPGALGLSRPTGYLWGAREFWACSANGCNIAAVGVGEHTYCAVGKTDPGLLATILGDLVGRSGT